MGGQSPRKEKTVFDECKRHQSDEIKRKYFDVTDKDEKDHHFPNSNISEKIVKDPNVVVYNQTLLSSGDVAVNASRSNTNERMIKTHNGGYQIDTKTGRPNTPPLTLYSNEGN